MKQRKSIFLPALLVCCVLWMLGSGVDAQAAKKQSRIIYVNRAANCVTVSDVDEQGNETPIRAFACSCGRAGHETPTGTFETSDYYDWCLMVDNTYGKYAIRFNKGIMFHSVPYLTKSSDSLEWDQYNLLGESASLGCVRLCCADVKWIYDNCKKGTTVVVYDDAENPGPLGKPETTDIPEDSPNRDWDPTDTTPGNPWFGAPTDNVTYSTFDALAYAELYPDVKAAFGTKKTLLWRHYTEYGRSEGRTAPVLGQAAQGSASSNEQASADKASSDKAPAVSETYANFDAAAYAERYPDVKAAFGTNKKLLWNHYLQYGKKEGRIAFDPSGETYANFDAKAYAERYPDVKAVFGTNKKLLWNHYLQYGKKEGRIAF